MRNISKVSEITPKDVADYIRLDEPDPDEINLIKTLLGVATAYIEKYTGQDADDFPDFVIAVLILVQDMWDNRALYVSESNVNKVVQTILDMHATNLL